MYWDNLNLSIFGVTVLTSSWPYLPVPKVDIQEVPFAMARSQRQSYSPRTFNVKVLIEGDDREDLESNISSLFSLFAEENDKALRFDAFRPNNQWFSRYQGGLEDASFVGLSAIEATLTFIAPDPSGSEVDYTNITETITSSSHSFTLTTRGNWYANPLWTIKASHGASAITFINSTTTEELVWSGTLAPTEWLRIDSDRFFVEKTSNSGSSWAAQMLYVSGRFPRLAGGVENQLTIYGVTSGATLEASYRMRTM